MRTYTAKPKDALADRKWWIVDATDAPLGRLASRVATLLRGKHKVTFTPHVDTGDFVIVVNAERVKVTGAKADQMKYYRHSGYPGALKEQTFRHAIEYKPELPITHAVKGMLPKSILGRQLLSKLKVYTGPNHPHQAQTPETLSL